MCLLTLVVFGTHTLFELAFGFNAKPIGASSLQSADAIEAQRDA